MKLRAQFRYFIAIVLIAGFSSGSLGAPLCAQIHNGVTRFSPQNPQIVARLDALIELQVKIQRQDFENRAQLQIALEYFERETKGLKENWPEFQSVYQARFRQIRSKLLNQQKISEQTKIEIEKKRKENLRGLKVKDPHFAFQIQHLSDVKSLAFNADGKTLITSSQMESVSLFDLTQGAKKIEIDHPDLVYSLSLNPDGESLFSGSQGGWIRRIDLTNQTASNFLNLSSRIWNLSTSRDGKHLAVSSGSSSGSFRVYEASTKHPQVTYSSPNHIVYSSAFSPDSKFVAAGFADGKVIVLDLQNGSPDNGYLYSTFQHPGNPKVIFSADGQTLITAGLDGLRFFDLQSKEEVHRINLPGTSVQGVALSPDGQFLLVSSSDLMIRLFDYQTREEIFNFRQPGNIPKLLTPTQFASVGFSPDSSSFATVSGGTVSLFHIYRSLEATAVSN